VTDRLRDCQGGRGESRTFASSSQVTAWVNGVVTTVAISVAFRHYSLPRCHARVVTVTIYRRVALFPLHITRLSLSSSFRPPPEGMVLLVIAASESARPTDKLNRIPTHLSPEFYVHLLRTIRLRLGGQARRFADPCSFPK
jgi:hypothetical protein